MAPACPPHTVQHQPLAPALSQPNACRELLLIRTPCCPSTVATAKLNLHMHRHWANMHHGCHLILTITACLRCYLISQVRKLHFDVKSKFSKWVGVGQHLDLGPGDGRVRAFSCCAPFSMDIVSPSKALSPLQKVHALPLSKRQCQAISSAKTFKLGRILGGKE